MVVIDYVHTKRHFEHKRDAPFEKPKLINCQDDLSRIGNRYPRQKNGKNFHSIEEK